MRIKQANPLSALHHLVGRVERALQAYQYAFDIQAPYDNTPVKSVKTALGERRVPLDYCYASTENGLYQSWADFDLSTC